VYLVLYVGILVIPSLILVMQGIVRLRWTMARIDLLDLPNSLFLASVVEECNKFVFELFYFSPESCRFLLLKVDLISRLFELGVPIMYLFLKCFELMKRWRRCLSLLRRSAT